MPFIDDFLAVAFSSFGFLMLRLAWRMSKGEFRDDRYPTPRHALVGRIAKQNGRTGWIVYNTRKNRLETSVVGTMGIAAE